MVNAPTRSPASRGQRLIFIVLCLVLVAAVLFYTTIYFGRVYGTEFSPDTFNRRSFSYFEIPLVNWQVTPMQRDDETGDLETYLRTSGLVPRQQNQTKPRWDLIVASRSDTLASQGEARILAAYLDAQDSNDDNVWLEWSKAYPELAKVLWPAVVKVARHELYILVPDLLLLARTETDADALQAAIDLSLSEGYLRAARYYQHLGNPDAALKLATESLSYDPESTEAQRLRDDAQAAGGSITEPAVAAEPAPEPDDSGDTDEDPDPDVES